MDKRREPLVLRIHLVRQLLCDALRLHQEAFAVSRMRSLLSLDLAIELLVSTLLSELGVTVKGQDSLPKMLQELICRRSVLGSYKAHLQSLRRLRNGVQHDGVVPSSESIRQALLYGEAFIRDAVQAVLGKPLEELSLVMLVSDERSRRHLERAEQALEERDYSTATTEAAVAFAVGVRNFRRELIDRGRYWGPAHSVVEELIRGIGDLMQQAADRLGHAELKQFSWYFKSSSPSSTLRDALGELVTSVELAQYGIELQAYHRFREVTPYVFWALGADEPQVWPKANWSPGQQDALFAFDFAVTSLLKLQGSLQHVRPDNDKQESRDGGGNEAG